MKWRRVESPLDTGGRNACVPAPAAHRPLLPRRTTGPGSLHAHQTMSTTEIISHLVNKARPVCGANAEASKGRGADEKASTGASKRSPALSKSKTALAKAIGKSHRQRKR